MKSVLHIGAARGEVDFYANLGVEKLIYAEPDRICLKELAQNIRESLNNGSQMQTMF